MTESLRALEVMGVPHADQRRSPRRSVHAGGTISAGSTTHIAWIKDVSEHGICLFTNHLPKAGERVRVTLNGAHLPENVRRAYEGKVVRVQESGPGAAVVAIMLSAVVSAVLLRVA